MNFELWHLREPTLLRERILEIRKDGENELTPEIRELISMMNERIKDIDEKLDELELKHEQSNQRMN